MENRRKKEKERGNSVTEPSFHCYSEQSYSKWLVYHMQDQTLLVPDAQPGSYHGDHSGSHTGGLTNST